MGEIGEPLTDEEIRQMGWNPTPDGWKPLTIGSTRTTAHHPAVPAPAGPIMGEEQAETIQAPILEDHEPPKPRTPRPTRATRPTR